MPKLARPTALMMPIVTVWPMPNGSPIASTRSPIRLFVESANSIAGSCLASTRSTATSLGGSVPTTVAASSRPSLSETRMVSASAITWLLVRMMPSLPTMTPLPSARSRCGAGAPRRGPKKYSKNGSLSIGDARRLTTRSENTLTTLGITFSATSAMVRPDGSWTAGADGAATPAEPDDDGAADPGAADPGAADPGAADPDDGAVAGGARSCDESGR